MQDPTLFHQFQSVLFQRVGIHLRADEKWPLLLSSFTHKELESVLGNPDVHSPQWEKVFHILNISETYFYRDPGQLDAIFQVIFPELLKGKANPELQIWSAGCSKGEEVYTLAILTKLYQKRIGIDFPFRVLGTDIQASSLQVARLGEYSSYSIRSNLPLAFQEYLEIQGNTVRIVREIKDHVQFQNRNLLETSVGSFDLILCRNVLIYLGEEAKVKILQNLTKSLREGGAIVLGHSEYMGSLPTGLSVHSVSHKTTYYRYCLPTPAEILTSNSKFPTTSIQPIVSGKKKELSQTKTLIPSPIAHNPIVNNSLLSGSSREKAMDAHRKGKREEAMSLFQESLYDEPKQIEAYYYLANYYWENRDYAQSRSYQAKARIIFKNDSSLADQLKKSGRWEDSFSEFLSEDL